MKIVKFFKKDKQIDTEIEYVGLAKYMPLIICGGFFLITIMLFALGPFEWNIANEFKLFSFLILAFVALSLGYILGVKIKRKKTQSNFDINHIIYVSFIIFIIMYFLNSYATTGEIFPNVIRGLFNSGDAYSNSHAITGTFSILIIYLGILIAPLTSFLTPLYFIYFKNLSLTSKILGTITLILNLCVGIAQGVINTYAILVFEIIMFLLIYLFSNFKNKSLKKVMTIITIIIAIGASFLIYYKTVMGNRLVSDAQGDNTNVVVPDNNEITDNTNTENKNEDDKTNKDEKDEIKEDNKEDEILKEEDKATNDMFDSSAELISQATLKEKHIYSFLPDSIESSLNHITSYITHGYKGLSIALDKEFTSSYGLGFSDFFRHNLLKVIGKTEIEEEIYQRTYMYKLLQSGWATGSVWVSFFVYPASDIGFPLTILLVFGIGLLFSLAWRDTIESKNIFATVIFMNLCMIVCFFSANNVYLQNGGPFLTIVSMLLLWLLSRIFGKKV